MLVQINRLSEDYFNEKGAKDGKPLRRKGQNGTTDERRYHGEWDKPSAELMTEQLPGEYGMSQGID